MGRKPKPETLAKAVAKFNAAYPVGSTVIYAEVPDNPTTEKAVTVRSEAFVPYKGREVVVWVAGKINPVPVKNIRPTGT